MSSLESSKKSVTTRNKSAQKKEESSRTAQMLQQLLMRPNITIKKTILLANYKAAATNVKIVAPTPPLVTTDTEIKRRKVAKKVDESRSLLITKNQQYYPDRQKRRMPTKKIVLQPKHEYKVVAATNKRKRTTPQKESSSPPAKVLESEPGLSIAELVRIVEDEGMDDEDFMEILTCPSPVWWEGGSDEEEIYTRFHEEPGELGIARVHQEAPSTVEELHENRQTDSLNRSFNSHIRYFKKYVKKRPKLENSDGIKVKTEKPEIEENNINKEASIHDRNDSVGGHSDNSLNEDELLKTLENIEIPVQTINSFDANATQTDKLNEGDKTIKNSNKKTIESNQKNIPIKRRRTRNPKKNFVSLKTKGRKRKTVKDKNLVQTDNGIVPTDLPPLTKSPFKKHPAKSVLDSPKSVDSTISGTTNSSTLEFDSISDTNIKYLDEYLDEKIDTDNTKNGKTKQCDDLVTVYKVVENNKTDNLDVEEQIKVNLVNKSPVKNSTDITDRKINSFYRTRKRVYRRNSIKQV